MFKGLTARRLCKSFGVIGLKQLPTLLASSTEAKRTEGCSACTKSHSED
jgi:hypothetical protein